MFAKKLNLQKITLLVSGLMLAVVFLAGAAQTVLAAPTGEPTAQLTKEEKRECFKKYDNDVYDLDTQKGRQNLKDFKASKCYKAGGNCEYSAPSVDEITNHNPNVATVNCTNPDEKTGGGGGGGTTGSGDGITDPAAGGCSESDLNNAEECGIVKRYINPLIRLLSVLVGIVAVIAIIFGAIQVSTSAGDPQKSASGKNHIRNALIGLVAYVLLFVFLQWIIPGGI
jgi:hypothetical protein